MNNDSLRSSPSSNDDCENLSCWTIFSGSAIGLNSDAKEQEYAYLDSCKILKKGLNVIQKTCDRVVRNIILCAWEGEGINHRLTQKWILFCLIDEISLDILIHYCFSYFIIWAGWIWFSRGKGHRIRPMTNRCVTRRDVLFLVALIFGSLHFFLKCDLVDASECHSKDLW